MQEIGDSGLKRSPRRDRVRGGREFLTRVTGDCGDADGRVGAADLAPESEVAQPDLLAGGDQRQVTVERVMDALRARLGEDVIRKGRGLVADPNADSPSLNSPSLNSPSLNSQAPGAPPASSRPRRP